MREDALFHAQVMFPFSSETSNLVDVPGAQSSMSGPLNPKVESSEGSKQDGSEIEKLEIGPEDVENLDITGSSSSVHADFVEDGGHHSVLELGVPETPNRSDSETLKEESDPGEELSQGPRMIPVWFGDLSRAGFDASYLSLRDQLSDAAYWGRFDQMFSVLAEAEQRYRQSWANAPRLSTSLLPPQNLLAQDDGSLEMKLPLLSFTPSEPH